MIRDPHDVVKVFSGPLEIVEAHKATLTEAGIACNVVGTELTAGLGTALPGSIELWVHRADLAKAQDLIAKHAKHGHQHQKFPHPTDSPKPGAAPGRKEPWINPDPRS